MRKSSEYIAVALIVLSILGSISGIIIYEYLQSQKRKTIDIEALPVSTWSKKELHLIKGETVRLRIINRDSVIHGFSIPELGVNERIIKAGKSKIIEFIPLWEGEFIFMCTVQCSVREHAFMKGKVIVEDTEYMKSGSLEKTDEVKIQILWNYRNLNQKMELYEPASQRPIKLWEMASTKDKDSIPISSLKIKNGTFFLKPGSQKYFVLIMKNDTKESVYFFATPHIAYPPESALGFKFKCLCINYAFNVNPGETWYRVVRLRLSENFLGSRLKIYHTLIGITKERMEKFKLKPKMQKMIESDLMQKELE